MHCVAVESSVCVPYRVLMMVVYGSKVWIKCSDTGDVHVGFNEEDGKSGHLFGFDFNSEMASISGWVPSPAGDIPTPPRIELSASK